MDELEKIVEELRYIFEHYPNNSYVAMRARDLFGQLDESLRNGNPPPLSWDWNPLYRTNNQKGS